MKTKKEDNSGLDNGAISLQRWAIGILFILLLIGIAIISQIPNTSAAVPKIEPYVNDFANVLTAEQILYLNQYLDQFEKNSSYEIAVVTLKDVEGDEAVHYANMIGDQNGVGKKGMDNGIIVLVTTESRDYAIAVGRGAESVLNDAKAGRIGRENAAKYFKTGDYYNGLLNIVINITQEIQSPSAEPISPAQSDSPSSSDIQDISFLVVVIILVIVIIIVAVNGAGGFGLGLGLGSIFSGGGGGGGGGSFGGGSFGGGGAGGKY